MAKRLTPEQAEELEEQMQEAERKGDGARYERLQKTLFSHYILELADLNKGQQDTPPSSPPGQPLPRAQLRRQQG